MESLDLNDIEVASPSVVKAAARDFAAALAETPQFKAFEQAYEALSKDTVAHQALSAYQDKVNSLRAMIMLNALSEPDRAELTALCQQLAGMISQATGLNYAAACGASCCG